MKWRSLLLSGVLAAGLMLPFVPRASADPPPWAGKWRHDKHEKHYWKHGPWRYDRDHDDYAWNHRYRWNDHDRDDLYRRDWYRRHYGWYDRDDYRYPRYGWNDWYDWRRW